MKLQKRIMEMQTKMIEKANQTLNVIIKQIKREKEKQLLQNNLTFIHISNNHTYNDSNENIIYFNNDNHNNMITLPISNHISNEELQQQQIELQELENIMQI